MKIVVIFVFATALVRIQGNPVPDEDIFEDGLGIPPLPTSGPAPPSPSSCGVRPISGARIVGGRETQKHSIPWQAMLRTSSSQFCGGSLIHPQWVLTAAHCIFTNDSKIWLGGHRKEVKEEGVTQEFTVSKTVIHPQYDPKKFRNDIALVKLDRPAILGLGVGLVCLGDDSFHLPLDDLNNQCLISGWGTLESGGEQPNTLQEVMVPLVSEPVCAQAYSQFNLQLHESMLCAGFKEGGKDSCQGDSGGPLVCKYNGKHYLEGVTSWGVGCAGRDAYGVYARVRNLRSFIDINIQS